MKRRNCLLIAFLSLFLLFFLGPGRVCRAERLVLAVLAKRGREAAIKRWRHLKTFLEEKTPYEVQLEALPFEELMEAVRAERVDLVLANPAMFVQFEVCCGLSPLLTLKNLKFGRSYTQFGGVIFVQAQNFSLKDLSHFRGKRVLVGAVNPASFGGWLAQRREFQRAGLKEGRDFRVRFYGTHDAVVQAVASGEVEVGCVRTDVLEVLAHEGKIRLEDFRVFPPRDPPSDFDLLLSTPLYPEWPLARAPRLKREVAETIASALLSLKEDSPLAQAMEASWTIPYNYQPVHDCLRELGAPPYKAYRAKILREARARYFKFIVGLTAFSLLALTLVIYILVLHRRLGALYQKLKDHTNLLEDLVYERTKHLVEEREKLAVILRSLGEAVLVTERGGKVVLLNPAAEKLLGLSSREILGRRLCEVIRLEFAENSLPDEVLEKKMVPLLFEEAELSLPSGKKILVEGSAAPIRSNHEVIGTVFILRDITARKHLEAETQKASKLETLRLVAGGVAHDFNNLLLSIVGYLEIMRLRNQDPQCEKLIRRAEQACFRARTLTRELLTYTTGTGPVKSVVQLDEVLKETVSLALSGSAVKAVWDLSPDLWPAELDPDQIVICFQNILINARQAMPQGGTVYIRARNQELSRFNPYGLPPGPYVVVEIEDTGPGIPEEDLEKIFEPFYTTKQGGSGLGLFSCRRIIEAHGGAIEAESSPGGGALIRLLLPACPEAARQTEEEEPLVWTEEPPSARILIMDDEKGVRESMAEILSAYGFEVETAADGEEALEKFREAQKEGRPFDLVILDLTVPGGFGGKELLPRLREIDPDILAIVASGYSSDPVLGRHEEFGFQAALIKPFATEDLLRAIQQVLKKRPR